MRERPRVDLGAEGANPPRNLSGKRTAWARDSEALRLGEKDRLV
ncbi:hypothetical protein C8E87_7478 [Paractinoplanes brasiliensis]|uniref:Uncharacterized protein n=1 Tax=Paractinoplanes brasiliensis TaxID=52695 RepID=A0A4R6J9X6_9ACTN|nr:hypothetical protein C8E87_7478 [Actinoplanes brasiliensis]